ncbi:MAG: branched-chain amino acid transport system II carrier protein [Flavobacteriaceae bacterium]
MHKNKKDSLLIGLALFAMFFGAGNLTLPPLLGLQQQSAWGWVSFGFIISGVVLPILAIYAHAKLQGSMYDFGKKVSPKFSLLFCAIIYLIAVAIPAPRTAALTHEMSITPYIELPSLLTSTVYFFLVYLVASHRSKIIDTLGKILTPLIVGILIVIVGIGCAIDTTGITLNTYSSKAFFKGFLEGYQTFDAIGGMVIGGVLIISLNLKGYQKFEDKRYLLIRSSLLAGTALALIYISLIFLGAKFGNNYPSDITRPDLLRGISTQTLGNVGTVFLSALVSLACFTTAVGIVTGAADYFSQHFKKPNAFKIIVALSCVVGVLIGQLNFNHIILIAIPILMVIYPITIVFIILNALPEKWAAKHVFKWVTAITILGSLPDVLHYFSATKSFITPLLNLLPLGNEGFGWVTPTLIVFLLVNMVHFKAKKTDI